MLNFFKKILDFLLKKNQLKLNSNEEQIENIEKVSNHIDDISEKDIIEEDIKINEIEVDNEEIDEEIEELNKRYYLRKKDDFKDEEIIFNEDESFFDSINDYCNEKLEGYNEYEEVVGQIFALKDIAKNLIKK